MNEFLSNAPDETVFALFRVAKTRAYAFFRNPVDMIALRTEYEKRKQ